MAVYLLIFELSKEDDADCYELFWTELRRQGAQHVLKKAWIIDFEGKPESIRDHFRHLLDEDDRLFVTALVKGGYTYANARGGTNDWLLSSHLG